MKVTFQLLGRGGGGGGGGGGDGRDSLIITQEKGQSELSPYSRELVFQQANRPTSLLISPVGEFSR